MTDEEYKKELESIEQEADTFGKSIPKEWRNTFIRFVFLLILCVVFWQHEWLRLAFGVIATLDLLHFSALLGLQVLIKRKLVRAKKLLDD
jgi:hypothetical protein